MSSQEPPTTLQLKPIISYPREAQVGKTYLVSIDVQLAVPDAPWNFPEEEYTIGFILNTSPYFTYKPLHDVWPTVILHRYGGTYGPAEFLLTAAEHEIERGQISITLVNGWGIPMTKLELPCEVKLEGEQREAREIALPPSQDAVADHNEQPPVLVSPEEQEERERVNRIAAMLTDAGWAVMDMNSTIAPPTTNIAIQVFPHIGIEYNDHSGTEYDAMEFLLVVDAEVVGMIVRDSAYLLIGPAHLADVLISRPRNSLWPSLIRSVRDPFLFIYEMQGEEIHFTNHLEPEARSRIIFHFHRPETFALWLKQAPVGTPNELNDLLRSRLRHMPPLQQTNLRPYQSEALINLERSLAENRPRALIQMATGSGKTYMAVSSIYRLLKFGGARRILYLADRSVLTTQAMDAFQQFVTPDNGLRFTELYNVQLPINNNLDPEANVCLVTIQRLYSLLASKPYRDNPVSEASTSDQDDLGESTPPKEVRYNPKIPIEFFDFVIIDECHRSIYQQWRPVLEYFDAFLIGLTAVSSSRALAFFNRNLVMQYSRDQALADGLIVDYEIYRIRTMITEQGSKIEHGTTIRIRNRRTLLQRNEILHDDFIYSGDQLDREVVATDQIRTILTTYRETFLKTLYPDRKEVPKTLIFAKNDNHADDIVQTAREVFGRENNFVQKVTARVKIRPEDLIRQFRDSYLPRIIVAVDMLSTGVDIKPLEVLLFMRPVKSRALLEQMIGIGYRTITEEEFQTITPDTNSKKHFTVFDAADVTAQLKGVNHSESRVSTSSTSTRPEMNVFEVAEQKTSLFNTDASRNLLKDIIKRDEQIIDDISLDKLIDYEWVKRLKTS